MLLRIYEYTLLLGFHLAIIFNYILIHMGSIECINPHISFIHVRIKSSLMNWKFLQTIRLLYFIITCSAYLVESSTETNFPIHVSILTETVILLLHPILENESLVFRNSLLHLPLGKPVHLLWASECDEICWQVWCHYYQHHLLPEVASVHDIQGSFSQPQCKPIFIKTLSRTCKCDSACLRITNKSSPLF